MTLELTTTIFAKPSVRHHQEGQRYESVENTDCGCSYNFRYTWRVPEVQQKLAAGNALCSLPFYTEKNGGYKMRLFRYDAGSIDSFQRPSPISGTNVASIDALSLLLSL